MYGRLWTALADEPLLDELVSEYTWETPLRVVGGLHYLVLAGDASWDSWRDALVAHAEFLRRFIAEQGVQTNEVQRSWMLLPCFLEVARRGGVDTLDLIELGPSAGLNLVWDRYRYRYDHGSWGPAESRVELGGDERQAVPADVLLQVPRVRSRIGIDRAPIDVTTEEGARLLECFVWPDQTWRLEQLERAIAALRMEPPELRHGDVVDELPGVLAERRPGALTVVFQTAVLGYLPRDRRRLVYEMVSAAGEQAPVALVESSQPSGGEHTYWGLWAQLFPGGERLELAHADFHGAWLEWLGAP